MRMWCYWKLQQVLYMITWSWLRARRYSNIHVFQCFQRESEYFILAVALKYCWPVDESTPFMWSLAAVWPKSIFLIFADKLILSVILVLPCYFPISSWITSLFCNDPTEVLLWWLPLSSSLNCSNRMSGNDHYRWDSSIYSNLNSNSIITFLIRPVCAGLGLPFSVWIAPNLQATGTSIWQTIPSASAKCIHPDWPCSTLNAFLQLLYLISNNCVPFHSTKQNYWYCPPDHNFFLTT